MVRVFINPGHAPKGIPDPGAMNYNLEKRECDIALEVASLVVEYLRKVGVIVEILQNDSLASICQQSDNFNADVFVSIHADAFDGNVRGTRTFYCPGSYNGGRLADCIQKQIVSSLGTKDRGTMAKGYYVLRKTNTAYAALVEMEFIDNDEGCRFMLDHIDEYARAIARGITDYIVEVGLE